MARLTWKQERFAFQYAKDGHGTNAAIRAGYAVSGAHTAASDLLKMPKILALIDEHKADAAALECLSLGKMVRRAQHYAFADRSKLFKVKVKPCGTCYSKETLKVMKDAGMPITLPNPECELCLGNGIRTVWLADTATLTPEVACLITAIEQTKDGIKIKTVDPIDAMVLLGKLSGHMVERKELSGTVQVDVTEKPLSSWTRDEIQAEITRLRLQNSVKGVLEGVSEDREHVTIDAKLLSS